jgi:hypothetical protein
LHPPRRSVKFLLMISKGYVAVFSAPLGKLQIRECVLSWIDRFEKLEQVIPNTGKDISTCSVSKPEEIMWEENLQFRVLNGGEFAWIYVTLNKQAMETSGLPMGEISLCLDVLLELPGVTEVVNEENDRRLNELETGGLL